MYEDAVFPPPNSDLNWRRATIIEQPYSGERAAQWDHETRSGEAILASEYPAFVFDWASGQVIREILLADGGQFASRIPVLLDHSKSVRDVIGYAHNIRRVGSEWHATIQLGGGDDERKISEKIRDRLIGAVSIGYRISQEDSITLAPGESVTIGGRVYFNEG